MIDALPTDVAPAAVHARRIPQQTDYISSMACNASPLAADVSLAEWMDEMLPLPWDDQGRFLNRIATNYEAGASKGNTKKGPHIPL